MITKQKLEEVRRLSATHKEAQELASELLRTAQDRFNDKQIIVKADDEQSQPEERLRRSVDTEMTEKVAWDEVWTLGLTSKAGQALREKYPKVFEAFEDAHKKSEEYHRYVLDNFGVDFRNMEFIDILEVLIQVVDQRMNEHLGVKSK